MKLGSGLLVIGSVIFIAKFNMYGFHIKRSLSITSNAPLSLYGRDFIKKFSENYYDKSNRTSESLTLSIIQKNFPAIKSILLTMQLTSSDIIIELYNPVCTLNNKFVLLDNNYLLPRLFFSSSFLNQLPDLSFPFENIEKVADIVSFIEKQERSLFNDYMIEFIDKHTIYITDKADALCTLVCTYEQTITKNIIEQCLKAKSFIPKHNNHKPLMMDIRFTDYIIAYNG
jgi:hypothetical protein